MKKIDILAETRKMGEQSLDPEEFEWLTLGLNSLLKIRTDLDRDNIDEYRLIAKQSINIDKLETQNEMLNKQLAEIQSLIVCVGGPLNDNKHNLSVRQQCIFHDIVAIIET